MPIARFEMPDGRIGRFEVPEGTSPEQAQRLIASSLAASSPQQDEAPKRKGVGAALSKGTESLLGSMQTTLESPFGVNRAAERSLERSDALDKKYEEQVSLDKLKEAYEKRGLTGAGGELLRQVPLALAEQAPNIGTSLGSAKLGSILGTPFGGLGKAVGAGLGALAPSALQLFGSNVERQAAEQKQAGVPTDISTGKALAATAIQAPLDVAATYIPLGGKIIGKMFGPEVEKILMRGGTQAAEKLAQESFAKTLGKGLGVGALAEIPTEVAQQVLERAQAGLPLTSKDALEEYGQTAYQVSLLAPIGGAGRFVDKSAAKSQVAAEQKEKDNKLAQEQQAAAQEALLNKQAQEEMAKIASEQKPVKAPMNPQEFAQMKQGVFNQKSTLERELDSLRTEASKESDVDKLQAIGERAQQIQKGLDELNPEIVKQEINKLAKDNSSLNKQIKALDKKEEITEEDQKQKDILTTQLQQNTARFDTLKERLPILESFKPEATGLDIKNKLKNKLDAITKAREAGDLVAISKLTKEYKELQAQYPGDQQQLFDTTKQGDLFYPEENMRVANEQRAAAQKQKEEFDAQALKEAEEKTRLASPPIEPATKEDITAYKAQQEQLTKLKQERTRLQELFDTANSTNDIRAAVDLQKLIEAKDKELAEFGTMKQMPTAEQAREQALETAKPDELIQEIKDLQALIKKADDQIKTAAGSTTALDKDGKLTPAGLKLAETQKQRDQALADLETKQADLDAINANAAKRATETQQTNLLAEAFPEKTGFIPEKVKDKRKNKISSFKRYVGDNLTVRAELMALRRKLTLARSKRNKLGKGANREEIAGIINDMREVVERIKETKQDNLLPTDAKQGAETVKYHQAINAVREKQQNALDKYLLSLEAYLNREYFGGETKKATTTKQGLEKRIKNDEANVINAMLEEAAINRRVFNLPPLTQEQRQDLAALYVEPLESFRLYAEDKLGAPERAMAVISQQLVDITDQASNVTGKVQKGEFGLRTQFEKPETEKAEGVSKVEKTGTYTTIDEKGEKVEVPTYKVNEQPALTPREKEAGKKVDVSNVGNVEQGELFSEQAQKATTKASVAALEKERAEQEAIVKEENSKKFPDLRRALSAQRRAQEIDNELAELKAQKPKELLEPIATVRSTPGMFRRFVDSQSAKIKKARDAVDQLISKVNTSAKKDYQTKVAPLMRELENLRLQLENHLGKNEILGVDVSRRRFEKNRLFGGVAFFATPDKSTIVNENGAFIKGITKNDLMPASAGFKETKPGSDLHDEVGDATFISTFNVQPNEQGKGYGKKLLTAITKWADENNKRLALNPAASGGLNQEQLKDWYSRNGFKQVGDYMVRKPNANLKTYDEVTKDLQDRIAALLKQVAGSGEKVISARQQALQNLEEQQQRLHKLNFSDAYVKDLRSSAEALWQNINTEIKNNQTKLTTLKKRGNLFLKATDRAQLNTDIAFAEREAIRLQDEKQTIVERIDSIYQEANELEHGKKSIELEKTILANLEKIAESLDGIPKAAKEAAAYADKLRADIAKTEAVQAEIRKEDFVKTQRFLERFNLPGIVVKQADIARVNELNKEIKRQETYLKKATSASSKRAITQIIEDLRTEKAVAERPSTELAPTRQSIDAEQQESLKQASDMNAAYAMARKLQKERQAEVRRKEGLENAQNKWDAFAKQLGELKEQHANAKTKRQQTAIWNKGNKINKQMLAIKATPTPEAAPKSQRAVGPATRDVQPAQFKTGVKKYTKKQKEILKETSELAQEIEKKGFSEDAHIESGLSASDFGNMFNDVRNGDVDFRIEENDSTTPPITKAEAEDVLSKIKMPKGLKVFVLDKIPADLKALFESMGHKSNKVKGWVSAKGDVYIVAENHTSIPDLNETIAHELIGHVGVEALLGEQGMRSLIRKIISQEGGVLELAKKLGVFNEVYGTYASARRQGLSDYEAQAAAVREMIAHTAEKAPNRSMTQKLKDFIKLVVAHVRDALRKMGVDLKTSTSDIYKIIHTARTNFENITPGAFVNADGAIKFNVARPKANAAFEGVLNSTNGIVAQQKPLKDRIFGSGSGLVYETKYVDRFAPISKALESIKDSLKATQTMYYLRMHDQRMAFTSEVMSNGPLDLVPAKDGKGFIIESKKGTNLIDVINALKTANVGDVNATNRVFTMYLLALRAKDPSIGLAKLNYSGKITQEMLDYAIDTVEKDAATKASFEKAAAIYAKYNEGLINFAVKAGAINKTDAAAMLKNKNYVPFYRVRSDGSVFLEIGGAPAVKIGNLAEQPYLHELVGGDQPIFDVFTSALQNTSMLTDMALRNIATKNTANTLADLGLLKTGDSKKDNGIHKGGKDVKGPDIIRFKSNGEDYYARINSEAAGVPSELLVKGLEGVNTSLPNIVKMLNVPSTILRKWVTRNPAYMLRQLVRDPLNGVITAGLDTTPIVSSMKEVIKMVKGKSEGEALLQGRGILGGQVLTGTTEDQQAMLKSLLSGEKGWDYRMAQLDQLSVKGDAATRVVMYNNYIKQGLSEMEATLATLEAMNFSKRGISASLFQISTMVPFMNAQIQGLNVLWKSFTGKMPFNEKLKIKQKAVQRSLMLVGSTMLYAAMMQDDEAYKNANDDEKYGNWFVYTPFSDEPVKVPIPFEVGLLFKAVPEALVNTIFGDAKARDTMSAIGKQAFNSLPNVGPQAIKPALEAAINFSFYTGRGIESDRLMQYEPGERYEDRTSEIAKLVGGALNISPVKIEYLIKGYFGSIPLAVASMANPIIRLGEGGEKPESRGMLSSDTPLLGTFFQPVDAGGLINKAYKDMDEIDKVTQTYKKMVKENRDAEAEAYLDTNADIIGMGSMAGRFRKKMGDLTNYERAIRTDPDMTAGEKRKELDEIKQLKIETAKYFSSVRE
jgi:GNAT superfamily N-acetyltransferase